MKKVPYVVKNAITRFAADHKPRWDNETINESN